MYYLSVPVEDVDELLLLNSTDHNGATLGVNCQILARHNPAVTCLQIRWIKKEGSYSTRTKKFLPYPVTT
jgi:hypothetical protein